MKIEMGESLVYTWLRHVCECQIVQTNWKVSPKWTSLNRERAFQFMELCNQEFHEMFNAYIFNQNANFYQVLGQGECDALGVARKNDGLVYYGVDIAFHTNGLGYGNYRESAAKVIEKCVRTAMCLFNCMNVTEGKILFLSPKIQPGCFAILQPAIDRLNALFLENGFNFLTQVYNGDRFKEEVLQPSLALVDDVNDTSELFLRSVQMLNMFDLVQDGTTIDAEPAAQGNVTRTRRVKTTYTFGGNSYKMGRLALEIVKNYVGNNPDITFHELQDVFSQILFFNRKPIVRRMSDLTEAELAHKRAYINADDLIAVSDANDVCVSTQWSKDEDMPTFLNTVRNLGFEVIEEN